MFRWEKFLWSIPENSRNFAKIFKLSNQALIWQYVSWELTSPKTKEVKSP